jgi:hypothetical protein
MHFLFALFSSSPLTQYLLLLPQYALSVCTLFFIPTPSVPAAVTAVYTFCLHSFLHFHSLSTC